MAVTLVVEDGTGKSTANSYQSEANAVSRLEELMYLMGLSSAPSTVSDEGLIAGAHYLDAVYGSELMGIRTNEDQALEFPRTDVYKDAEREYMYDSDELPEPLLKAHALASYYAENDSANIIPNQSNPGTIKRESSKVGELQEDIEYIGGKSQYKKYSLIDEYMYKLSESFGGGSGYARRV